MRRGEIRLVDFEPARGSEANKQRRPAVIVSSDGLNQAVDDLGLGVVTVVPMTSNTTRVYPFQVFVPASESGLESDSKLQAEQIRAVDVGYVHDLVGALPPMWVTALDDALRVHLDL